MSKQSFTLGDQPKLTLVQIEGDLIVKGWEQEEVVVDADPEDVTIEQGEDWLKISCVGDCIVRTPAGATWQVENVGGDASMKYTDGDITVGVVHGSLEVRQAASLAVEKVLGTLAAREIAGDLRASMVHGNAELRDIQGNCWLNQVSANIDLRDIDGEIHAQTGANARLRLSNLGGADYSIQAGANVHCHIPEELGLQLHLNSGAGVIRLKLPDGTQSLRQHQADITLGDGAAAMNLSAGATISLISQQVDWPDIEGRVDVDFSHKIAKEVEDQIQMQMEAMNSQLAEQMERLSFSIGKAGLSAEESERIAERARQASARASERAQEKMRRAQEKLERKLEAAQRRRETQEQRRSRRTFFEWDRTPKPPTPPTPPAAPVSEEERLMILRMLEAKKINLEDADRLLSALEGK